MKPYLFAVVFSTCCLNLGAADQGAPPSPTRSITSVSATVDLVPGKPEVLVHVTNGAKVPLESWQIHLTYELDAGQASSVDITSDTCYDMSPLGTPGRGPILSGATRDHAYSVGEIPKSAAVTVRMALFSDLSSEGARDEVSFVLGQREQHAKTLTMWIGALQTALAKPAAEAKVDLERVIAAEDRRLNSTSADSNAAATLANVRDALSSTSAAAALPEVLSNLERQFEQQRAKALRHRVR